MLLIANRIQEKKKKSKRGECTVIRRVLNMVKLDWIKVLKLAVWREGYVGVRHINA